MASSSSFTFVSYNMHGYNQGVHYMKQLCSSADLIFLQEHWLPPSDLHRLQNISDDFICFSSSAMGYAIDRGVLVGRPFGGVAILVRSSLARHCKLLCKTERYIIVKLADSILVNVYMPCASVPHHTDVYCDTLASILACVSSCSYQSIVFGGDLNFDFNVGGPVNNILSDFIDSLNLVPTHGRLSGILQETYRHATLHASSLIDHFLVSSSLLDSVHSIQIIDDGCNVSDHIPLVMLLSLQITVDHPCHANPTRKEDFKRLRWDKADLSGYYDATYVHLSAIDTPVSLLTCDYVDVDIAKHCIESFYNDIVTALCQSTVSTVPVGKANFFKFWWDQECQAMKEESISKHQSWKAAGRPRDGPVASAMRKAKYEYKLLLKHKSYQAQSCFSNELHDALVNKDFTQFWRSWNAKLGHRPQAQVINGCTDHGSIAEAFSELYAKQCLPNNVSTHARLQQDFRSMYTTYVGSTFDAQPAINVELVDFVIRGLKHGKAAGPDGISAEHLLYSHPLLCVLLSVLIRMMLKFSYVPDAFGTGTIIPLLKGDDCDPTVCDNYRAITISPCISKVFELCLSSVFQKWLGSDELQLGFKKGMGCRDAIFTLRNVVSHITNSGSTAVLCALDISKAFDKMNHYALYIKLMQKNIPRSFLAVLVNWYSKCFAFVRWGNLVSRQFQILAGVRQGGVLSPCLFALFIDSIIFKLRLSGAGAFIGAHYVGCLLYADDIMLVCHSLTAMQRMLDICSQEADSLDFSFNTVKSVALRIGPRYKHVCAPLVLAGIELAYVQQTKYLGVVLKSAREFKCSFDQAKIKFYRCFNAMYYRAKNASSELVCVHLLKTICLPVLLYAVEVIPATKSDISMLDHVIDRAVFKIFRCDDVKYVRSVVDLPCVSSYVSRRFCNFRQQFAGRFSFSTILLNCVT